MKTTLAILFLIPFATLAEGLGALRGTLELRSEPHTENAWSRSVVTMGEDGTIRGDNGTVAETATTKAIDSLADELTLVSTSSEAAMRTAIQRVHSATNGMARNYVGIAVSMPPELGDDGLAGYCVKTVTDGTNDTDYVWYKVELSLKPIRFVRYADGVHEDTVKCEWIDWSSAGESVTVDGRTWSGCHRCKVARPAWARGKGGTLNIRNEKWGGDNGMDFGDMTLTMGGVPLLTGFVTNYLTNTVLYFNNGFLKTNPNGGEE